MDDGIELGFADGIKGLIPYAEIPEVKSRQGISRLELPNPYEMVLQATGGQSVEIPWDFARHYCDPSYRPAVEALAALGRQTVGGRVRTFRQASGLTQEALAKAAGIGRVTLVRLENGEQSPKFKTLNAVAAALGVTAQDLLVEPDFLPR